MSESLVVDYDPGVPEKYLVEQEGILVKVVCFSGGGGYLTSGSLVGDFDPTLRGVW